jgi:arsenate reductase (thioredoxin)
MMTAGSEGKGLRFAQILDRNGSPHWRTDPRDDVIDQVGGCLSHNAAPRSVGHARHVTPEDFCIRRASARASQVATELAEETHRSGTVTKRSYSFDKCRVATPEHRCGPHGVCAPRRGDCPDTTRLRGRTMGSDKHYNVLFLCTGNSARSIFAEAILNRLGRGTFRAFSAGSRPKGEVHPLALDLLRRLNFSTEGVRSKGWEEFSGPSAPDFVFTVCDRAAAEECPVWPGQPMTAQWGVADPSEAHGDDLERVQAFRTAFKELESRIAIFVNLPFASLDHLKLQQRLHEIGGARVAGDAGKADPVAPSG